MMEARLPLRAASCISDDRPRDPSGRELISVRALLEWAFAVECASLDHDEVGQIGPDGFGYRSATANICDMLALGDPKGELGRGVKVDAFGGRSYPHDDAETVAAALRTSVPWSVAVDVAELARTCRVPQWDLGAPRIVPRGWSRANHRGQSAAAEVHDVIRYRSRRGMVERKIMWCPVEVLPTPAQRGAARRAYLAWYDALLIVRARLRSETLTRFSLTDAMPKLMPWKKTC